MMDLEETLRCFGLEAFRPGQREVIESVLASRPTIAVLPTGAGKSLCYQLPAVALGGLTVVVSPLIALMKDQVDALVQRGIPAAFINSTLDAGERDRCLQRAVRGELRLLYVAPERFRVPGFVAELKRARVVLLAVDEAHCIAEWGHDFRPDYARLGEVIAQLQPARLIALTATATHDVRADICRQLAAGEDGEARAEWGVFVRGFDRPNLHFAVLPVDESAKLPACVRLLGEANTRGQPVVIYTATRKKAEKVAQALAEQRFAARAYHAGLDDEARTRVQELWMAGQLQVIVATNAFGMGVDKRDVRLVIHHDLPGSLEAYYQEAGRAGRDGEPARCVLLFNHADVRLREFLITSSTEGVQKTQVRIDAELRRLRGMMGYAYARRCRRGQLLGYFGDPDAGVACAGCDVCEERRHAPAPTDDEHLIVRKVLATVARLDGRLGRNRIALVLEGSTARDVTDARLDRLSTYGVLRGRTHAYALDLLGALEAAGLIVASRDEYPTLRMTPLGREVMHDRQRVPLSMPAERPPSKRERTQARAGAPPVEVDAGDPLFQRLRTVRARLAQAERVPAYVVFHDRTLAAVAKAQPRTLAQLAEVPGLGPSKLAKYGDQLLQAIAEAAQLSVEAGS